MSPNEAVEAYTGNLVDRKGKCTPLKQYSLVTSKEAVDEGFMLPEVKTKAPIKTRSWRNCRGLRAWYARRETFKNLGDPKAPCWDWGRESQRKEGDPQAEGSPIVS